MPETEKPKIRVIEINYLQDFSRSVLNENNPAIIEEKLNWFLEHYEVINYYLETQVIWRVRRCKSPEGYRNVNELSYPPKSLTPVGRLNEKGSPIFYASFHKHTALEEIGAREGDYVHLSGYKVGSERKLRGGIVGEIVNVHRSGRSSISDELAKGLNGILHKMPHKSGMSYVFMDAFVSSILRDKKAKENNYIHSRVLSKLLLNSLEGRLDAIFYPSIALEGAMNVAIKPESVRSTVKMIGNSVIKILKKNDYGIYDFEIVKNANGFYSNGEIKWQ